MVGRYTVLPPQPIATEIVPTGVVVHPVWCDPEACTTNAKGSGSHNSRAVRLHAARPSSLGVAVNLSQGMPVLGYPRSAALLVDMTFLDTDSDPDDYAVLPLDIDTAQRLGQLLAGGAEGIAAGVQASRGRR